MNNTPSNRQPIGITGKITRIFLQNTELSILTILILAAWGIVSFVLMPKQYNPEIVAPAFIIVTEFPGATAEEVYEFVTRRIEDIVFEIPAVDEVSSESRPGGISRVTVKFDVGSDREDAKITLNQKLRDNMGRKPAEVREPIVQAIDPDDVPILDIGLSSEALSESSLRKLAWDLADQLKLAPGVSLVEVKGGHTRHLQVAIDATKLAALDLTLTDVTRAIQNANGIYTLDTLSTGDYDPKINISGNIRGIEDLALIIIREREGAIVRVGDIAHISYSPGDIEQYVRERDRDGSQPMVHIAFSKLRGTNSSDVSAAILSRLEEAKKRFIPSEVEVSIQNDEGKTANEEITKLTLDLVKSILIVGALLYIFLGAKNSLVAAISIPLVLLAVFGTGYLFDQSVNRITLFALILSLGLLVDDAIVVVENIARYFRLFPNENKFVLIVRAVDEVGGALALSTFTMALAFVPMAFVTGMMGPYMGPIPFFVPVALLASLLFAVTINPFLAHIFSQIKISGKKKEYAYESGRLYRAVQWVEARYAEFLARLLREKRSRRRFLTGIVITLFVALALPLSPLVPFRMLPKADKDQFYLYIDLPDGNSVERTNELAQAIESVLFENMHVVSVESFVGQSQVIDFNGLFKGSAARVEPHQATLKVHLTSHTKRSVTSEVIASDIRARLATLSAKQPDATLRIIEDPPGPPVLSTFLLKVKGENDAIREAIVADLKRSVEKIDGIVDIDTSLPERGFHLPYRVNREKAERLGIAPTAVIENIHTALSGTQVGLYHESFRQGNRKAEEEYIVVRLAPEYRKSEDSLLALRITGKDGKTVPLSEILEPSNISIDTAILSDQREKTTYLAGEMEGRSVIYAVIDLFPTLINYALPNESGKLVSWSLLRTSYEDSTTGERYQVEIDGEWKLTLEVFRDLGIAMGLALFLIYFLLAAKTQSLFVPLLIMVSIPLSLIGVLPGFALLQAFKGTYFNATSMIGVIALAGLAVKNAVIYLEYLEPLKRSGKRLEEALVEAGRIRLLPIALTSLAAILGSLTIVSDPVWEGLAWSIILGLSASTILTLVVFPIVYSIFERKHWEEEILTKNIQ